VFNFRDLSASTHGLVRDGVLFRSNALARLDAAGRTRLRATGLRRAIDLRDPAEQDALPVDAGALGVEPIVVPLNPPHHSGAFDLERYFISMLEQSGAGIARAVTLLSDPDHHPAVFYCSSGKDRSGLLAGLLLGVVDVPDVDVAADFAVTEAVWPPEETERAIAAAQRIGIDTDVGEDVIRAGLAAPAELMLTVLGEVRQRHGSVAGYLEEQGASAGALEQLRGALLAA
jgi:protein-tyrosine phosphatase